jgi:hypothetical protein
MIEAEGLASWFKVGSGKTRSPGSVLIKVSVCFVSASYVLDSVDQYFTHCSLFKYVTETKILS